MWGGRQRLSLQGVVRQDLSRPSGSPSDKKSIQILFLIPGNTGKLFFCIFLIN